MEDIYKIELDNDFFDMLLYPSGEVSILSNKEDEFLPKELTHSYLLNKTSINENVLNFYYSKNQRFQNEISDSKFKSMQEHGYLGTKQTMFPPYSIKIHGAYHTRAEIYMKLHTIKSGLFKYKINGNDVRFLNDLEPYFKDYSEGFKKGFFEFEDKKIKPFLPLNSDKQDFANLNFEFVKGRAFSDSSPWFSLKGFSFHPNDDFSKYEISNAYEDGINNGYKYRAWSYILSNNVLFTPLFIDEIEMFKDFNNMANYLFNHKLLKFDNDMFTDPKTIKFQFVCWEQIIQFDFDNWLQIAKGFQRFAGDSYDGYLTMNNMYDFAKWYNENKQLQEKNNNEFKEKELKRVGLINEVVQPESDFDTNDKTNPLIIDIDLITGIHNNFRTYLFETIDIDNFKNCFRVNPISIKKRNGITVSELSYFFSKIEHLQTGVSNFGEWMGYHIKGKYGNKKNEFVEIEREANIKRNGYSLTVPQKKALANKHKIDDLFNKMQPN